MTGKIVRLEPEKKFGMVSDGASEFFFHRSCLRRGGRFEELKVGDVVTFEIDQQSVRRPRVCDVSRA